MELVNWLKDNYVQLLLTVSSVLAAAELVTRFTPTKKDDAFLERAGSYLRKLMDLLKVPNNKSKDD